MHIKWSLVFGGFALLILLVVVSVGMPGKAQSEADTIHQVLSTVVDERIPPLTENGFWGYTLPDSSWYAPISSEKCLGEVVYLHGERWINDEIKQWGAMSIQTCPSDAIAAQALENYQPEYLDAVYNNVEVAVSLTEEFHGLTSRSIDAVDSIDTTCTDPIIAEEKACYASCAENNPIKSRDYDDEIKCEEDWGECDRECEYNPVDISIYTCRYYHKFDETPLKECSKGCQQVAKQALEYCSGTNDIAHIDVWRDGNYVFMAQAPIFGSMNLSTVLEGCQDYIELREILKEEADKAGLKAAAGQQSVPQQPAVPVEFIAQIGINPNPPAIDQETVFSVDVRGNPPGEGLSYSWYLDDSLICQSQMCSWQASSGKHRIQVVVESSATKRQATNAIGFEVIDSPFTVVDDKQAGFTIDYLGCNDNITSDETLTCTAGFTRQAEGVGKLTVRWLINGLTAATESHTDNGSVFSMDKPAPGTHTVEVQIIDPATGMARVRNTAVDVVVGSNATLPPGAQTGAAVGTLTGIGGWLWSEWFRARRGSKATPAPKKYAVEKEDSGEVKYDVEKEEEKGKEQEKGYDVEVDKEKDKQKNKDYDVEVDTEKDKEKNKANDVEVDKEKDKEKNKAYDVEVDKEKGKQKTNAAEESAGAEKE